MPPIQIRKHVKTPQGFPMWYVTYHGQLVGMYRNGCAALAFVHKELKPTRPLAPVRQIGVKGADGGEAQARASNIGKAIGGMLAKAIEAQKDKAQNDADSSD